MNLYEDSYFHTFHIWIFVAFIHSFNKLSAIHIQIFGPGYTTMNKRDQNNHCLYGAYIHWYKGEYNAPKTV